MSCFQLLMHKLEDSAAAASPGGGLASFFSSVVFRSPGSIATTEH